MDRGQAAGWFAALLEAAQWCIACQCARCCPAAVSLRCLRTTLCAYLLIWDEAQSARRAAYSPWPTRSNDCTCQAPTCPVAALIAVCRPWIQVATTQSPLSYVNMARNIFHCHGEATVSALGNAIDPLITGARTAGCQTQRLTLACTCCCLLQHVCSGHSPLQRAHCISPHACIVVAHGQAPWPCQACPPAMHERCHCAAPVAVQLPAAHQSWPAHGLKPQRPVIAFWHRRCCWSTALPSVIGCGKLCLFATTLQPCH